MVTHRYGLRRPLVPVSASLALVVTLLAGCSSSGDEGITTAKPDTTASYSGPGVAASPSAGASGTAAASPSALPTGSSSRIAGSTLAGSVRAAAVRDRTVSTKVVVTGPLPIQGDGAANSSSLKVAVTLAGQKGVAVVRAKGDVYLKLPGQVVPGKDWVAVPRSKTNAISTMYANSFEGYGTPSDLLITPKVLGGLGSYTVAGTEQLEGTTATKYTVRTSATKAAQLLPPAYQPVNPSRMKAGRATVSAWVDASGRLLRTATTATIPSTKQIKVLITYTGWGKPVDVSAPPSGDVGRLS